MIAISHKLKFLENMYFYIASLKIHILKRKIILVYNKNIAIFSIFHVKKHIRKLAQIRRDWKTSRRTSQRAFKASAADNDYSTELEFNKITDVSKEIKCRKTKVSAKQSIH